MNQRHYGYLAITDEFLEAARSLLIKGELIHIMSLLLVTIIINIVATYSDSTLLFILQVVLVTASFTRIAYTIYNIFAINHLGIKQVKRAAGLDGIYVEEVSGGLILQTKSITNASLNTCAEILVSIYNKYPDKLALIKSIKEWIFSEDVTLRIKAVIYTEILMDQLEGGNTSISVLQNKLINFDENIAIITFQN